jgi:hypothetical protein
MSLSEKDVQRYREDPMKRRPSSERQRSIESEDIKKVGRVRLSSTGRTIVIIVEGKLVGFIGKIILSDVINRKSRYAYIYKYKNQEVKK